MAHKISTAGNSKAPKSSFQDGLSSTKLKQISKALTLLREQLKKAVTSKSQNSEVKYAQI